MSVTIRKLNVTLNELRLIAKKRNIDGYKRMSRNQLINLISPTLRPPFKIQKYTAKSSKTELKDFTYFNCGYLLNLL